MNLPEIQQQLQQIEQRIQQRHQSLSELVGRPDATIDDLQAILADYPDQTLFDLDTRLILEWLENARTIQSLYAKLYAPIRQLNVELYSTLLMLDTVIDSLHNQRPLFDDIQELLWQLERQNIETEHVRHLRQRLDELNRQMQFRSQPVVDIDRLRRVESRLNQAVADGSIEQMRYIVEGELNPLTIQTPNARYLLEAWRQNLRAWERLENAIEGANRHRRSPDVPRDQHYVRLIDDLWQAAQYAPTEIMMAVYERWRDTYQILAQKAAASFDVHAGELVRLANNLNPEARAGTAASPAWLLIKQPAARRVGSRGAVLILGVAAVVALIVGTVALALTLTRPDPLSEQDVMTLFAATPSLAVAAATDDTPEGVTADIAETVAVANGESTPVEDLTSAADSSIAISSPAPTDSTTTVEPVPIDIRFEIPEPNDDGTYTFTVPMLPPDSGSAAYQWRFEDGTTIDGETAPNIELPAGQHTATLTLHDAESNQILDDESQTITVPLRVVINASPLTGEAPLPVAFDVNSNAAPDATVTYLWNFGDDLTAAEPMPEHTFMDAGEYTINVVVSVDGIEPKLAETTVTVTEPLSVMIAVDGQALETGLPLLLGSYTFSIQESADILGLPSWTITGSDAPESLILDDAFPLIHNFTAPGTYMVSVEFETASGRSGFGSLALEIVAPRLLPVDPADDWRILSAPSDGEAGRVLGCVADAESCPIVPVIDVISGASVADIEAMVSDPLLLTLTLSESNRIGINASELGTASITDPLTGQVFEFEIVDPASMIVQHLLVEAGTTQIFGISDCTTNPEGCDPYAAQYNIDDGGSLSIQYHVQPTNEFESRTPFADVPVNVTVGSTANQTGTSDINGSSGPIDTNLPLSPISSMTDSDGVVRLTLTIPAGTIGHEMGELFVTFEIVELGLPPEWIRIQPVSLADRQEGLVRNVIRNATNSSNFAIHDTIIEMLTPQSGQVLYIDRRRDSGRTYDGRIYLWLPEGALQPVDGLHNTYTINFDTVDNIWYCTVLQCLPTADQAQVAAAPNHAYVGIGASDQSNTLFGATITKENFQTQTADNRSSTFRELGRFEQDGHVFVLVEMVGSFNQNT